ncbi:MAG: hypothetical protein ACE5HU_06445 [Acidobacteriota bacterium]
MVAGAWDGSIPRHRPAAVKILSARDLVHRDGLLGEEELVKAGRCIGLWAAGLQASD